jgi:hypothetical protein
MTFGGSMDCIGGVGMASASPRVPAADIRTYTSAPARTMLAATAARYLVDCFRHLHPTAKTFSCLHHASFRLLDRIFVSSPLLTHVHQCHVDCRTASDHRPVIMHLRPAVVQPAPLGHGRPRHAIAFDLHADLVAAFTAWAACETAVAPAAAPDLLAWWPAFKKRLIAQLRTLYHLARLPTHDPTNSFKAYDAAFLRRTPNESPAGFVLALELTVKAHAQKLKIEEFPTTWRDRTAGESRFNLRKWLPLYLRWYFYAFWH